MPPTLHLLSVPQARLPSSPAQVLPSTHRWMASFWLRSSTTGCRARRRLRTGVIHLHKRRWTWQSWPSSSMLLKVELGSSCALLLIWLLWRLSLQNTSHKDDAVEVGKSRLRRLPRPFLQICASSEASCRRCGRNRPMSKKLHFRVFVSPCPCPCPCHGIRSCDYSLSISWGNPSPSLPKNILSSWLSLPQIFVPFDRKHA
ncbi:hypothetical protein RvY_18394-2 [Ramazzottius varieornatus]|uniref:Uncharacterized protein n=1 Tax=Ramazzottius varieornatus TaxID=947166 RepID=A0A1D1WAD6_RAMVA|nr:hypothetical protein RvY_18394-2 [Ramazzottius varieornatus]